MNQKTKATFLLKLATAFYMFWHVFSVSIYASSPVVCEENISGAEPLLRYDEADRDLGNELIDVMLRFGQNGNQSVIEDFIERIRGDRTVTPGSVGVQSLARMAVYFGGECNKIVGFLLDDDYIGVDDQDVMGNTLLHYAAIHRNTDVVNILLKRNARTDIVGQNGMTARALAEERARYSSNYDHIFDMI